MKSFSWLAGTIKQAHIGIKKCAYLLLPIAYCTISVPVSVNAFSVSESFTTTNNFQTGQIVSLNTEVADDIVLATTSNSSYLLGVVADIGNSSLNFNKKQANVSVALSGVVDVYVLDVEDGLQRGDFIGASWLEGVGMKADTNTAKQELLGVVQESYDFTDATQYGEIETPSGAQNVSVGVVSVRLFDKKNATIVNTQTEGLREYLSELVGKDISLAKVFVGTFLFLISLVVASLFIGTSIRGSFYSIGRNPLASASIHSGMVKVSVLSFGIILIGAVVSYAVLVI